MLCSVTYAGCCENLENFEFTLLFQMVIDNKIDDIRTILSQHLTYNGSFSPQLHGEDVITRCHEHCRCRKCRQLIAATFSNGRVPSSTVVVESSPVDVHVPLQSCLEVDKTVAETVSHVISAPGETEGRILSLSQSSSIPNGQIPSALQSVSTSVETEDRVSSNSCSYITENGPLPSNETSNEAIDLIYQPSTDNNAQVSLSSTCGTVQDRPRCHPLCSCDRCSQLVSSDDVVETGPDVFCRNERGFSGKSL